MPQYRLKELQVEAFEVPEGCNLALDNERLETGSWLVLRNSKLAAFTDDEFQAEFEPVPLADSLSGTLPPAGGIPGKEKIQRKKRKAVLPLESQSPDQADPMTRSPHDVPVSSPRIAECKTLADFILVNLYSRALTLDHLLTAIEAQGKATTSGSLYHQLRTMAKDGRILFDPERNTYRIPLTKRAGV